MVHSHARSGHRPHPRWQGQTPARALLLLTALLAAAAGCRGGSTTTMPGATTRAWATAGDVRLAETSYWLAQPGNTEITHGDFQALWDSCERVAQDRHFRIARRDYRGGLLTTEPLVSRQWFEFWRSDGVRLRDVEEASLGPIRRTVYFQFARNPDGSYTATPKVVVEREARPDPSQITDDQNPGSYWYALRRDEPMELALGAAVRSRLERGR